MRGLLLLAGAAAVVGVGGIALAASRKCDTWDSAQVTAWGVKYGFPVMYLAGMVPAATLPSPSTPFGLLVVADGNWYGSRAGEPWFDANYLKADFCAGRAPKVNMGATAVRMARG